MTPGRDMHHPDVELKSNLEKYDRKLFLFETVADGGGDDGFIGDQELELQVHVGTVLLELENRDVVPALQTAIEPVFTNFTFRIQEGRFMKTEPSLVDYCKYGPNADKTIIGLSDPKSKSKPVILQGTK